MLNFKEIHNYTKKPEVFAKGTHLMWSDPYIAEQLQQVHLNPEVDLASRKPESIDRTVRWMSDQWKDWNGPQEILELGCGPGLYTERLAAQGHKVTGLDISERSLQTARERAQEKGLDLTYHQGNYLEADLGKEVFDVVFIVYIDFGVLAPDDQKVLLEKIYRALKPGGIFLFDVLHAVRMEEKKGSNNWECVERGFWNPEPHLVLHDSIPYPEDKAILEQHLILTEEELRCYRFWTRFYTEQDLEDLTGTAGFRTVRFDSSVLPDDGIWNGDNVVFCVVEK